MKNFFSADEPNMVVEPEFSNQPQRGTVPTAPACNPHLPVSAPVPLPPPLERIAQHAAPHSPIK